MSSFLEISFFGLPLNIFFVDLFVFSYFHESYQFAGERTNCYVCLARTGDPASVSIACELHFRVVQVDPSTGEVRRPMTI